MTVSRPTCFITGAASGIGAQCARALAERGHNIVLADVNAKLGQEVAEQVTEAFGKDRAAFVHCDVTSAESIKNAITATLKTFSRLDVAINCAGITGGELHPIHEMTEQEFDKVHSIDAKGVFLCLREEIAVMRQQEPTGEGVRQSRGVIVNVSSRAGLEGVPTFGAYCAAKHAVQGLTKVAALENATHKIRVNSICPGLIKTPGHTSDPTHTNLDDKLAAMMPMQRWGEPAECVDGIVFLATESSSFMTGATLEIDGGMAAKSR
ncbi:short-chain alcohol dehydrogenase-like protein [Testicularia cyperi]|uniref:Short-chain alcohol dehydrogenase-like protein n=1 Tax=Testicularia cyperi TaxID=1882483 RepID=A0A317XH03_9BASI|nr:short-chain alcohol dehydrogenase-like protein [Testicularia cyperi]